MLVATEESLEALNKELDSPVDMRRFRPNIIVKGTKTFDEVRTFKNKNHINDKLWMFCSSITDVYLVSYLLDH